MVFLFTTPLFYFQTFETTSKSQKRSEKKKKRGETTVVARHNETGLESVMTNIGHWVMSTTSTALRSREET
jgi:hypothetical protein